MSVSEIFVELQGFLAAEQDIREASLPILFSFSLPGWATWSRPAPSLVFGPDGFRLGRLSVPGSTSLLAPQHHLPLCMSLFLPATLKYHYFSIPVPGSVNARGYLPGHLSLVLVAGIFFFLKYL